ncbi:helix-turn-helix domain-containing protein [Nocardia speluncae]|uniref:Helix-turn-helix domain-containing protein n=1 Tax=Nocardia speluncae TaxID=419477 RepID=A0A846XKZ8_9NOCA|nr:helix-turn-helix domain-containing protein [Nocardia speluncae]NKY35939.1 helix-turn-helix domain-containing protein [Nocardia speluncae]
MDVAIVAMDGVADLGLTAVLETFALADRLRHRLVAPPSPWRVHTVSTGSSIQSGNGYTVPTVALGDLQFHSDAAAVPGVLIVPAVQIGDPQELIAHVSGVGSRPILDWIGRAHSAGVHIAGACAGTFFLAEAGVLDGLPATTSWWLGPAFRKRYTAVDLDESLTVCRTESVVTAGAYLAHVDLALSLIHTASPALAEKTARFLVTGSARAQADHIVPEVMAQGNSLLAGFEHWVRRNIGEQFRISTAAHELGITERSLQRITQAELGMSPKDFVHDIRIAHAAHLLRTTSLSLESIASRVGYLNAGTLRNLVRRRRGMSVAELRAIPNVW